VTPDNPAARIVLSADDPMAKARKKNGLWVLQASHSVASFTKTLSLGDSTRTCASRIAGARASLLNKFLASLTTARTPKFSRSDSQGTERL
jgi:hypothetical protein